MSVTVEVVNASAEPGLPPMSDFQNWCDAAVRFLIEDGRNAGDTFAKQDREVSIRLVDEDESASLNSTYRDRHGPTNVLSFRYSDVPGFPDHGLLGDLAICAPVILREAVQQRKHASAHWAHMTVHGLLHLCGYDHQEPRDAEEMEGLETRILDSLGFDNPYLEIN